jgi:hypothetical protein
MKTPITILLLMIVIFSVIFIMSKKDPNRLPPQEIQVSEEFGDEPIKIPGFLTWSFSKTDFSKVDKRVESALSGGPGKDGIPALSNPQFESINDSKAQETVQAIVLKEGDDIRAYPYNILIWHEIVNDEIGPVPVAVTFCPLCGSAIVYDRRAGDKTLEFGVSGALIDSNMVMYDKETESLWQQSTGVGLAGKHLGTELEIVPMQLMTIGEIKQKYPTAEILSENTGHRRNYDRNPYSGYDDDDSLLFFPVGDFGATYPAKEIMVAFKVNDAPVAIPFSSLNNEPLSKDVSGEQITLTKTDGEVEIRGNSGEYIPFYFEMWFSFSAQHGKDAIVL